MHRRVLIIGGGFAGVQAAKVLGNQKGLDATLLTPHPQLEYHGALYRTVTGRSPLEVVLPFHEIFTEQPSLTVVNDFMVELRPHVHEVRGESGRVYPYDDLLLCLGYEIAYFGIPGMQEHSETVYTIFDSLRLRNRLRDTFLSHAGREVKISIVGAGPSGVEVAGDLGTFAGLVAERYDKQPAKPVVTLVERAPRVLPMFSEEASWLAGERLGALGVELKLNTAVNACHLHHLTVNETEKLPADIVIWTAGSRASSFFEKHPALFSLDQRKKVEVSEFLQANDEDTYVLGDAASTQFSGMAQTAIYDGTFVAQNLIRKAKGEAMLPYQPKPPMYVVPIGPEWAIAQEGDKVVSGEAGWAVRREADLMVLRTFLPEEKAQLHWKQGLETARF